MIALAATVIALVMIYNGFRSNDTSSKTAAHDGNGNHHSKSSKSDKKKTEPPKTYVVHEGDNLGIISDKFKVRVPVIEKLNPKIDPQTLHAGQTLFLR